MTVRVVDDADTVARLAADEFITRAATAIASRGRFAVALSGGSTPRPFLQALAARAGPAGPDRVAWDRTHVFWSDERPVPPTHPESNARLAHDWLLSRVPIPSANVHRIRAELDPEEAAGQYEAELRHFFAAADRTPAFDLVYLGLGPDAHTASLFPGSRALDEQRRLVVAPSVEKLGGRRISLTPLILNAARAVVFLVTGEDKAPALRDVLEGEYDPARLPAQIIRPLDGTLVWLVDRPAARLLRRM